eukprot:16993-Pleurochrysis_carterae.AAC.1
MSLHSRKAYPAKSHGAIFLGRRLFYVVVTIGARVVFPSSPFAMSSNHQSPPSAYAYMIHAAQHAL